MTTINRFEWYIERIALDMGIKTYFSEERHRGVVICRFADIQSHVPYPILEIPIDLSINCRKDVTNDKYVSRTIRSFLNHNKNT